MATETVACQYNALWLAGSIVQDNEPDNDVIIACYRDSTDNRPDVIVTGYDPAITTGFGTEPKILFNTVIIGP